MNALWDLLGRVADLGGPVVMILLAMSLIAGALILAKLWQFHRLGVGRHQALIAALGLWDTGADRPALHAAAQARSHLGPVAVLALSSAHAAAHDGTALRARLTGEAAMRLAVLSSGLRLLESIAQVAPLLGLFGTVLGMIEAFQSLQAAGASVDPSSLAGGIWVALLTTAVGLAVAMPSSLILSWLDGRIAREAAMAERIIDTALCAGMPGIAAPAPTGAALSPAHA
jgi:biopolymer transport protein ExbB